MKKSFLLYLAVILTFLSTAGCATYLKVLGGVINKDSYLKDLKPLIGKEYYPIKDLNNCSSLADFSSLTPLKLSSLDVKLISATNEGDNCEVDYFLDPGNVIHREARFYYPNSDTTNQIANMTIGAGNYNSRVISYGFAQNYKTKDEAVEMVNQIIQSKNLEVQRLNQEKEQRAQSDKLKSIRILLVGESNGVKVTLDIGNIPDQTINANNSSFQNKSVIMSMELESNHDIKLNGILDSFIFEFNGKMANTQLISLMSRRNYPQEIFSGSKASFDIEITPDPFVGFIMSIPLMKSLILDGKKQMAIDTYKGKFIIQSENIEIPMEVQIIGPT